MAEEENQFNNVNAKPHEEKEKKRKIKKKKKLVREASEMEEEARFLENNSLEEASEKSKKPKEEKVKSKEKRRHLLKKINENKGDGVDGIGENQSKDFALTIDDGLAEGKKDEKKSLEEADEGKEGKEVIETRATEENVLNNDEKMDIRKIKRKIRLLKEAAVANNRGICYLSRIPPHMDPFKLRQLLLHYGEIQRIYLIPENSSGRVQRKRAGRFQEQGFSEGWVEFSDKRIAKRVANMLNGEQIGGRKRSSFYYDLWNIKYLSKFKWDDLTDEIAHNNAAREQKLALEISAAKRERDFYLSKVDQARALSSIEERLKKKQKLQEAGADADQPVSQKAPKVIRKFQQKQPVTDKTAVSKPGLSRDILAGVFGGS